VFDSSTPALWAQLTIFDEPTPGAIAPVSSAGVAGEARRGQAEPADDELVVAAGRLVDADGVIVAGVGGEGLSHLHISAHVVYNLFASRVKVDIPSLAHGGGGLRGKVKTFSAASRRRLRDTCHSIRRDALPVFVTLTYPGEFPRDAGTWKRQLDNFSRSLHRIGRGRLGAIWKLEPQRRGAPHFHLLVWGVRNLKRFRQWLALSWYRIVGSGDVRHFRAGTQADQIRSYKGVTSYCSKYMGKLIDEGEAAAYGWDEPGRFWGILHREAIPWGEVVTADIPIWFAHRIKRFLRRASGYLYISHYGQTFYVEQPEAWFTRLDALLELSGGASCAF